MDGDIDFVAGGKGGFEVFVNDGDGLFSARDRYTTFRHESHSRLSPRVADFDLDGFPDVVQAAGWKLHFTQGASAVAFSKAPSRPRDHRLC